MTKPNVILINCDDLGYGDIGPYGSTLNRTPHIDRLAAEGICFDDFYMASPICTPSRGAMMTGCYPPRISFTEFDGSGVLFPGQGFGLHEDEQTIGHMMQGAGYRTKLVGKWHCGDQPEFLPTNRGFDEYYGLLYSNDMGRQKWREHGPPLPLIRNGEVIEQQPDQRSLTSRYTEECVRFIRDNKEQPFFLYLAHMYVHVPIMVPENFLRNSQNGGYGAAVEHIDFTLGVLLKELEQQGLDDDTIIIFTSDNGSRGKCGGSNGPLRGCKGTNFEGGQRLPCIVRWPKGIEGGRRSTEIATAMDFLPTLAEICDGTLSGKTIDGKNMLPLLSDKDASSDYEAFYYYIRDRLVAVRQGEWKLFLVEGDEKFPYNKALYNLNEDVGEQHDLSAENPEVVARLQALAAAQRGILGDTVTGDKGSERRPVGTCDNPKPLTEYDPDHPYIYAMYDTKDSDDNWAG